MNRAVVASSLGLLLIGGLVGFSAGRAQKQHVYFYREPFSSPPPMEEEDYRDLRQLQSIASELIERRIVSELRARVGDHARVRVVFGGARPQAQCAIEMVGGALSEREMSEIIERSIASGSKEAQERWKAILKEHEKAQTPTPNQISEVFGQEGK